MAVRRVSALSRSSRPSARGVLLAETWLVLGVSLGASAVYGVLAIVRRVTADVPLNRQTSALNSAVTPDRPWLDLAYQLAGIGLGILPALLAIHLLARGVAGAADPVEADGAAEPVRREQIGADLRRPAADAALGTALAALIGIPGLGLYVAARSLGLNTQVQAAGLPEAWWAVPVLVLAAAQNAVLEEVVMIGYLLTRWRQAAWSWPIAIGVSALIRGAYHLYQGFGGFAGNVAMGLVMGLVFARTRRVAPLILAHTLLDVGAFVGYALLADRLAWV